MSAASRPVVRLYRVALRVFPRRIRDAHGDEMAAMFHAVWDGGSRHAGRAPRSGWCCARSGTWRSTGARRALAVTSGSIPRRRDPGT